MGGDLLAYAMAVYGRLPIALAMISVAAVAVLAGYFTDKALGYE